MRKHSVRGALVITCVLTAFIVAAVMAVIIPSKSADIAHTEKSPPEPASLVIIGGLPYNGTFDFSTDKVHIYTVHEGYVTWKKEGSSAPYPWVSGGTAVSGSNVYIVGGGLGVDNKMPRQAARYNILTDNWELLPNISSEVYVCCEPPMYVRAIPF